MLPLLSNEFLGSQINMIVSGRQIVCAKSGIDPNRLLLFLDRLARNALLLSRISSTLDRNPNTSEIVQQGFGMIISNGLNANFWKDDWTGLDSLKKAFPRIYALPVIKHGPVTNFGYWIHGNWIWDVTLRRQLLD